MNQNLKLTRLACLLITIAMAGCPWIIRADDATPAPATTNTPVPAAAPEATPAPATTNTPEPEVTPATTNAPAPAIEPAPTNTPSPLTTPEATNAPTPEVVSPITNTPATTNLPAAATVPGTTNTPAPIPPSSVTNPPPATIAPAVTNQAVTTTAAPTATNAPAAAKPAILPPPRKKVLYQPFNIGADAGTTGYGGTAGWRFADHFGLVGGVDFFNYSLDQTVENIPYSADLHLLSEYVGLNLYPSRESSFRLSLGAYFNQNRFKGKAISDGSLVVDGAPVGAGESVNLEYKQQPVVPYASIGGNVYFDRARHFSLGGEFGAFYLGNPKVKTTSTDPLVPQANLNNYSDKVARNIKKVPVWPIIKISLNYSF